ncbi:hypothetical protein EDF46_2506 [Frondihabitans sp. PhB188]|uniref:hypothetical protein n=1 Tax=Frondihabitans sp. PhB188 TaxID=2485200 RepID=UPI000FB583F4|nr:hypothetical protein [Frondihabitans sp. PhB188]ROQ37060.1 hypothetical protein EDF46_2506 [Frondihabitans sp. PhB188]
MPPALFASNDSMRAGHSLKSVDALAGAQVTLAREQLNAWSSPFWSPRLSEDSPRAEAGWVDFSTPPALASFAGIGRRARLAWPVNSRQVKKPKLPAPPPHGCVVVINTGLRRRNVPLDSLTERDLIDCYPVRRFQRNYAQGHKPGTVWLHTNRDLVAFESQLERSFAVLADFHPEIVHIASQPMTMRFRWREEDTTHTPDYLILSSCGCLLFVDVKTPEEAAKPEWVDKHAAVAHQLAGAGMGHLVWTGMHQRIVQNLGMMASARPSDDDYNTRGRQVWSLIKSNLGGTLDDIAATAATNGVAASEARVLIRRMIWTGRVGTDLGSRFDGRSLLKAS